MKKKKKGFWKRNIGLAFVMPWLIGLLVFKLYPFAASFIYSFHSYNLFKTASFTGLENYKYILGDKLIIKAFIQTFKYAFLTVPLELMFALFIAYILNNKIRGLNFFRTIYYIPSILGGICVHCGPVEVFVQDRGPCKHHARGAGDSCL